MITLYSREICILGDAMETVWSLDVFDTIVTRDVYKSTDLFYFIGKTLQRDGILKISPLDFQKFRIEAERLSRIKSIHEEITLDEIYDTLLTILNLDKNLAEILKEKEIQLEKESLVPILENLKKISEKNYPCFRYLFRQKNYRGIFREDRCNHLQRDICFFRAS